jgi:hypothetical protein
MNIPDCWVLYCQKSVMMIGAVCSSCLGGKLMRLSPVQSEKSFFLNFLGGRERLFWSFPFLFARCLRKKSTEQ